MQQQPQTNTVQPGPQVLIYQQPGQPHDAETNTHYPSKAAVVLGAIQAFIGLLCIALNIAHLAIIAQLGDVDYTNVGLGGAGFWAGGMMVIAGVVGIVSGLKKTQCWIVSFMVLSILCAVLTNGPLIQGIIGIVVTLLVYRHQHDATSEVGVNTTLVIVATVELFIAIASSIICCVGGVCCKRSTAQPGYVINAQPQYMVHQDGQQMYVAGQAGGAEFPAQPPPTYTEKEKQPPQY